MHFDSVVVSFMSLFVSFYGSLQTFNYCVSNLVTEHVPMTLALTAVLTSNL